MLRLCYLFSLLISLPFWATAQSPEPEPVPKFRFGIPIPQVTDQGVKGAVLVDFGDWLKDSINLRQNSFQSEGRGKEEVVYNFRRDGKVSRAIKVFPYGYQLNADWEQAYLYDSLGRLAYIRARYVEHAEGGYVYPDSTAIQYDSLGRMHEIVELKNYRYHKNRVAKENGLRIRYTWLPGGRVAAREICKTKSGDFDEAVCRVDSVDFDGQGRLFRVRWIEDLYKDAEGNYPPERSFEYDAEGRLVTIVEYKFGTEFFRTVFKYDEANRVVSETKIESRVKTGNETFLKINYRADGLPDRVIQGVKGRGGSKFDYKILYDFY